MGWGWMSDRGRRPERSAGRYPEAAVLKCRVCRSWLRAHVFTGSLRIAELFQGSLVKATSYRQSLGEESYTKNILSKSKRYVELCSLIKNLTKRIRNYSEPRADG